MVVSTKHSNDLRCERTRSELRMVGGGLAVVSLGFL